MKKLFILAILSTFILSASANTAHLLADDEARQALYGALDQFSAALQTAPFGKAPIALLPLKAGNALLNGRVKSILVKAGFVCIEGKSDPVFNEILKEIEWGERKSDILDPATITKFGKLKAAKLLLLCDIRVLTRNPHRIYAEIEIRAVSIATGKVVWGDTFTATHYTVPGAAGLVHLTKEQYKAIEKGFEKARLSLETSPKLAGIKTISVVPISGDSNSYITNFAMQMLTRTQYTPQSPKIPSMSLIRSAARDGVFDSDAVLYGSVRAFYMTKPVTEQRGKRIITRYDVVADIHLFIEDIKKSSVLWGENIRVQETISSERAMNSAELKKYRKAKLDALPDDITEDIADNWKSYLKTFGIIAGVLIALALAVFGLKVFFSYNNVR